VDPQLGALADNGGFAPTMLPASTSSVIDAGDDSVCPAVDQRGVTRPQGAHCDIGALEVVVPHRCYVNRAASGANDGFAWASAYANLQSALGDANCNEIWVAKGVYKPAASTTDRSATFSIRPGIKVYGGFAGTETNAAQADPAANRTVLSGDIDNNDNVDADGVTRSDADIAGNNTYTVVRIDGTTAAGSVGADTVLDGFAISAGTGTSGILSAVIAGALYCDGNGGGRTCSPTLSRLWFAGNRAEAGGATFLRGENGGQSKPLLREVTFSGNRAAIAGSAVGNYGFGGEASPVFDNVTFSGNSAIAGAIFNQASERRRGESGLAQCHVCGKPGAGAVCSSDPLGYGCGGFVRGDGRQRDFLGCGRAARNRFRNDQRNGRCQRRRDARRLSQRRADHMPQRDFHRSVAWRPAGQRRRDADDSARPGQFGRRCRRPSHLRQRALRHRPARRVATARRGLRPRRGGIAADEIDGRCQRAGFGLGRRQRTERCGQRHRQLPRRRRHVQRRLRGRTAAGECAARSYRRCTCASRLRHRHLQRWRRIGRRVDGIDLRTRRARRPVHGHSHVRDRHARRRRLDQRPRRRRTGLADQRR
jgi:hypothetical protein